MNQNPEAIPRLIMRYGLAIRRIRELVGSKWCTGPRPTDMDDLGIWSEEAADAVVRLKAGSTAAGGTQSSSQQRSSGNNSGHMEALSREGKGDEVLVETSALGDKW